MSATLTATIERSLTLSPRLLACQGEMAVALTVNVDTDIRALASGKNAYLYFLLPNGDAFYKGEYDASSGSFGVTVGFTDHVLSYAGEAFVQLVIADDEPSDATEMWKTEMCAFIIAPSISAVLPASYYTVPSVTVPTTFPAENVILGDSSSSLIARNVEDALQELGTSPYYSVKLSGCVGDGVTDDTDAFLSAVDKAIESGKMLFIDPGTYLIKERIILEDVLTIEGSSHADCILRFDITAQEETAYDLDYYPESNAAIICKTSNIRLRNFQMWGGANKAGASTTVNGIIMHWTADSLTNYGGAERVQIDNVDVKYFKNGMFLYAGWNRYVYCCHFIDCSGCGVKWEPLEKETLGNWSSSGDVFIACQFIGNGVAGVYAEGCFETILFNTVCEYNYRAYEFITCNDMVVKNGWNEANDYNIAVTGCVRFEGGYNISPATVEHTAVLENDIVMFQNQATTTVYHGSEIRYNQIGGIVVKGVELSTEVDNMIQNPEFEELSGGVEYIPSFDSWTVFPEAGWVVSEVVQYLENNSAYFIAEDAAGDYYFGIRQEVAVETGKSYTISAMARTPDRSSFDSDGCMCWITHRNALHEAQSYDNREITFIADNSWEEKTFTIEITGDTSYLEVGFGCVRNGEVYFSIPSFSVVGSIASNNVFVRAVDATTIEIINMSGVRLGTIAITPDV